MLTTQARYDDIEYLQMHVEGLMQMISLRGGLSVLNQRLQMVLAWLVWTVPKTKPPVDECQVCVFSTWKLRSTILW